jgi:hypothetical protein
MKHQINFRASDLTIRQLEALMRSWGTSQTETLTVVIDRIYQQEIATMTTITATSQQDAIDKLAAAGIAVTTPPHAREFTVTQGNRSVDVVRTDVSEWAGLDLGLLDAGGSVLWMVEGVDPADVSDVSEYLDSYIDTMRSNDEQVCAYEWEQIREATEYAAAKRQLTEWHAG